MPAFVRGGVELHARPWSSSRPGGVEAHRLEHYVADAMALADAADGRADATVLDS